MFETPRLVVKQWLSKCSDRIVGPHADAIAVSTGDLVLLVDPADFGVGRHLRFRGRYGVEELDRLTPLVSRDEDVLVVGSHVGSLVVPLSRHCRRLDAIEANPRSFELLRRNLLLNRCDNVVAHPIAAGDRDGEIDFLAGRANSGGSKIAPRRPRFRYRFDRPETIRVPMRRLDDVVADRRYGLIVMDIEGAEPLALAGMPDLLSTCRHLYIEFVPHHLDDVGGVTVDGFCDRLRMFDEVRFTGDPACHHLAAATARMKEMYRRRKSDDGVLFSRSGTSVDGPAESVGHAA